MSKPTSPLKHPLAKGTLITMGIPGEDEGEYGPRWCPPGAIGEIHGTIKQDNGDVDYRVVFKPSGVWNVISVAEMTKFNAQVVDPASPEAVYARDMEKFAKKAADLLYEGEVAQGLGTEFPDVDQVVVVDMAVRMDIENSVPRYSENDELATLVEAILARGHCCTSDDQFILPTKDADELLALSGFGERFHYAKVNDIITALGATDKLEHGGFCGADVQLLATLAQVDSLVYENEPAGDVTLHKALINLRDTLRPMDGPAGDSWQGDRLHLDCVRDRAIELGLIEAPAPAP